MKAILLVCRLFQTNGWIFEISTFSYIPVHIIVLKFTSNAANFLVFQLFHSKASLIKAVVIEKGYVELPPLKEKLLNFLCYCCHSLFTSYVCAEGVPCLPQGSISYGCAHFLALISWLVCHLILGPGTPGKREGGYWTTTSSYSAKWCGFVN